MSATRKQGIYLLVAGALINFALLAWALFPPAPSPGNPTSQNPGTITNALCFAFLLMEITVLAGQGFVRSQSRFARPLYILVFGLLGPALMYAGWKMILPPEEELRPAG
jgi:hypothetical protein